MKRVASASFALVAIAITSPLRAVNLAEWNVAAANASVSNVVQVASTAAHVTAQPVISHGTLGAAYAEAGTYLYRNWPTGLSPDASKYYEFKIAPVPGYSIQLSSVVFAVGSGSGGPGSAPNGFFQLSASLNGFATPGTVIATETFPKDAMWHAFDLSLAGLGVQSGEVTFRFGMHRVGGDAYSGFGATPSYGNQGRNLVVNGTVFLQGEEPPACVTSATTLCIDDAPGDQRFQAKVDFQTDQGSKPAGAAKVIPLTTIGIPSGGVFWFTNPQNPEMLLKVLNACSANGHYWIFYAAGTNFALRTEVVDTTTGLAWVRTNPDRTQAPPLADIMALPCNGLAAPSTANEIHGEAAFELVEALESWSDPDGATAATVELEPRAACTPNANTLCIDNQPGDARFEATVSFTTTQGGMPHGFGTAIPLSSLGVPSGGIFWFTNPQNPEMLIKVLNGCPSNGHFWVFYAAGTNFALDVEVVDTVTGRTWTRTNPDRTQAPPIGDILALPCQVP